MPANHISMTSGEKEWLQSERHTSDLIREVYKDRFVKNSLSRQQLAENIYALIKITWITKGSYEDVNEECWRKTKIPALAVLYGVSNPPTDSDSVEEAVDSMHLPSQVAEAAKKWTGIVNLYAAFRNSIQGWVLHNVDNISKILSASYFLANESDAHGIANEIDNLPPIPLPFKKGRHLPAANALTPVVACLDPRRRFPIINSQSKVQSLLKGLGVINKTLAEKHDALVRLIGQGGIEDAFMIDVLGPKLLKKEIKRSRGTGNSSTHANLPPVRRGLELRDDKDVKIIYKSLNGKRRHLHNHMTNKLLEMCKTANLKIEEGTSQDSKFDALINQYSQGRDLLIEVKPLSERAFVRLAIGQLYDYRRFVPKRWATDLAVLLPNRPQKSQGIVPLLAELGIKLLWFEKNYTRIRGDWNLG